LIGSPAASFPATRSWSVKVEPSLRVPVKGRPSAAGELGALADAGGAADAGGWLAAGVEQAATISDSVPRMVRAPRVPVRIGFLLQGLTGVTAR
jgi:hypothetical protein